MGVPYYERNAFGTNLSSPARRSFLGVASYGGA
jgi:hypothetical protein